MRDLHTVPVPGGTTNPSAAGMMFGEELIGVDPRGALSAMTHSGTGDDRDPSRQGASERPVFTQLRRTAPTALSDPEPINPVPYVVVTVVAGVVAVVIRRRRRRLS